MFRILRRIKAKDRALVAAGLAVVVALEFVPENDPQPGEQPGVIPVRTPAMFSAATDLRYPRDPKAPYQAKLPPMGDEPRKVLSSDFRKAAYFGAFALSADGLAYGWSEGYTSISAADAAALARCHGYGPECAVIARLWPMDLEGEPTQPALSYALAQAYRQIAADSGPRAFACAQDGHWATARDPDPAQAGANALAACERNRKANRPPTDTPCTLLALWPE